MMGVEEEIRLRRTCEDKNLPNELVRLFYLLEKNCSEQASAKKGELLWKRVETPLGPAYSAEGFCVFKTAKGVALTSGNDEVLSLDLHGRVIVPGAQVFSIARYRPGAWEEKFMPLRRRSAL